MVRTGTTRLRRLMEHTTSASLLPLSVSVSVSLFFSRLGLFLLPNRYTLIHRLSLCFSFVRASHPPSCLVCRRRRPPLSLASPRLAFQTLPPSRLLSFTPTASTWHHGIMAPSHHGIMASWHGSGFARSAPHTSSDFCFPN